MEEDEEDTAAVTVAATEVTVEEEAAVLEVQNQSKSERNTTCKLRRPAEKATVLREYRDSLSLFLAEE